MQVSLDRSVLEVDVQRLVARFARLLPSSTVEGVRSFVGVLSRCLVENSRKNSLGLCVRTESMTLRSVFFDGWRNRSGETFARILTTTSTGAPGD
jgi:hypothetical protein